MRFSEAWAWMVSEEAPSSPTTHNDAESLRHWRKVYRKAWEMHEDDPQETYETTPSRSAVLRSDLSADTRRIMARWLQPNNRGENL